MIKIFIVDDHDLVRVGITNLLSAEKGMKVIGEAACGEDAMKALRQQDDVDVVLMDLKMPGIGGIETTSKLLRQHPDMKILILTAYEEDPLPARLLQAGACGYLTKDADVDEMVRAIRAVHTGQIYISPDIAQKMVLNPNANSEQSPFSVLSEREMEVTLFIISGMKVQVIAEKMSVHPKTVNNYRYRIFEKLKVNSDVELTRLALRHGIVRNQEKSAS